MSVGVGAPDDFLDTRSRGKEDVVYSPEPQPGKTQVFAVLSACLTMRLVPNWCQDDSGHVFMADILTKKKQVR